jgi:transcriptional regulator with XRE-family HTH domain
VDVAEWVNGARRSAGLTQRELAARSGVAQPMIAKIESGRQMPRADTLDRLLRACGWELDMALRRGEGEDRSLIR